MSDDLELAKEWLKAAHNAKPSKDSRLTAFAVAYAVIALCDRLDALTDEDNQAIRVVALK